MRVVLCADDYGINSGVSRAVVELAEAGRISATSAITASAAWPRAAPALASLRGRIGVGLHVTLTGLAPLGSMPGFAPAGRFPTVGRVISAALAGLLPLDEIAAEIGRQLSAFEDTMGRPPDFVDGHQHVHALPEIRRVLIEALARRGLLDVWLRDPFDTPGAILVRGVAARKALTVAALALGFGRRARRTGFATNRGFSGFSPFDPGRDVGADFTRFLAAPGPAHLVMCHPGHVAPGETLDGVVETRQAEFDYLMSDAFPALLAERGVVLVPSP